MSGNDLEIRTEHGKRENGWEVGRFGGKTRSE